MGVSVMDTKNETMTPKLTTTANDWKNLPTTPLIKITGPKIEISERLEAKIAKKTSLEPDIAEVTGFLSMVFR